MADVNGESFGGRWRCNLSYSTSSDGYSVTVSGTCQMQSLGYGMSLAGFYAHVDVNGSTNSTTNTSFYSPSGGWVTTNMISHSQTFSRTQSDYTIYINACVDRRDASYYPGKSIPTAFITIPALEHHTVTYNANGGTGAPSSQTKWYGSILTLSSTKPTKTGWTFKGWATSSTGSVAYAAGGQYGADADVTLYAIWESNAAQTIKFDANGGEDAPDSIVHQTGVSVTLPTDIPTRDGYYFLGWSKTKSGKSANLVTGGTLISMSARQTEETTFVWGTDVSAMKLGTTTVQDVELVKAFEAGNWIGHKAKEDVNPLGAGTYTMSFLVYNASNTVNAVVTLGARVSDSEDKTEDITVPIGATMRINLTFTRESEYTGTSYSEWLTVGRGVVYVGLAQIEEGTEVTDWADYTESAAIDYGAGWAWDDNDFTEDNVVTLYALWKRVSDGIRFYAPDSSVAADIKVRVANTSLDKRKYVDFRYRAE